MNEVMAALVIFSLAMSLFVETSTWWLRSEAQPGSIGFFVSRTNIFLYGGRFFALVFASAISFFVDRMIATPIIILVLALAFTISAISHGVLLGGRGITHRVTKAFGTLLSLKYTSNLRSPSKSHDLRIVSATALTSFVFAMGMSVPYVLASTFSEYRLTISNLGQILNSFGTLLLLFYVDQVLFASIDDGTIKVKVVSYSRGRMIGFASAALVLLIIYRVWPNHVS